MAVHIRLARHGAKKRPIYRVVVTDHRSSRNGRFIEMLGTFDPSGADPALAVDRSRLAYWTDRGARPSHTLDRLLRRGGAESSAKAGSSVKAAGLPPE